MNKKNKITIFNILLLLVFICIFCSCSSSGSSRGYNAGYHTGYDEGYNDGYNEFKENLSLYDGLENAFLESPLSEDYIYVYDHLILDDVMMKYMQEGKYDIADEIKNILIKDYTMSKIFGYPSQIMDVKENIIHGADCPKLKNLSTRYMLPLSFTDDYSEWESYNANICEDCGGEMTLY